MVGEKESVKRGAFRFSLPGGNHGGVRTVLLKVAHTHAVHRIAASAPCAREGCCRRSRAPAVPIRPVPRRPFGAVVGQGLGAEDRRDVEREAWRLVGGRWRSLAHRESDVAKRVHT